MAELLSEFVCKCVADTISTAVLEEAFTDCSASVADCSDLEDCWEGDPIIGDCEALLEAPMGADLSAFLGKFTGKRPLHARFESNASAPVSLRRARSESWSAEFKFTSRHGTRPRFARFESSQEHGTQETQETTLTAFRAAALTKPASRSRAWQATFQFTGIAGKEPRFQRFSKSSSSVAAGVVELEMARRCERSRSWSAEFKFTNRTHKQPQFRRFARPIQHISAAVGQLTASTLALRRLRPRSWAASFKFTGRTQHTPKCTRFADSNVDIATGVWQQRAALLSRKQARQRSWMGTFKFTRRTNKIPLYHRFACGTAQRPTGRAPMVASQPWSASFPFTDTTSKPKFARFATPALDIASRVHLLREQLRAARSLRMKSRSWMASFKFTGRTSKVPRSQRFTGAVDVPVVMWQSRATVKQRARSWASTFKFTGRCLMLPQFERFAGIDVQKAAAACPSATVQRQVRTRRWSAAFKFTSRTGQQPLHHRFRNPAALDADSRMASRLAAVSRKAIARVRLLLNRFASVSKTNANPASMRILVERPLAPPPSDDDLRANCRRCKRALRRFSESATAWVEDPRLDRQQAEVDLFLEEESDAKELKSQICEHLPTEELRGFAGTRLAQWSAGSPATAARKLRHSRPMIFQMDAEEPHTAARESSLCRGYAALGVELHRLDHDEDVPRKASALEQDLGLGFVEAPRPVSRSGSRSGPLCASRSQSLGALPAPRASKSSALPALAPKTSLLPALKNSKAARLRHHSASAWRIETAVHHTTSHAGMAARGRRSFQAVF